MSKACPQFSFACAIFQPSSPQRQAFLASLRSRAELVELVLAFSPLRSHLRRSGDLTRVRDCLRFLEHKPRTFERPSLESAKACALCSRFYKCAFAPDVLLERSIRTEGTIYLREWLSTHLQSNLTTCSVCRIAGTIVLRNLFKVLGNCRRRRSGVRLTCPLSCFDASLFSIISEIKFMQSG